MRQAGPGEKVKLCNRWIALAVPLGWGIVGANGAEAAMRRRELIIGGGAVFGAAGTARAATPYNLRDAAREAFIYTLPLNEIALVRGRILGAGLKPNTFLPQRILAGPEAHNVTTPNNDTIYASAFIDLSQGPVTLVQPDLGDRYASFALMDMWSDNFAVLGTRTTGPKGGSYQLVGPTDRAPLPNVIRSPTPWVWALARVVVNGESDLAAAQAVQAGYRIEGGKTGAPAAPGARREGPWQDYFRAAVALLTENPPPATDQGILRRIAPLGFGPGFDPATFGQAQQAEIAAGVADALALVKGGGGLGADAKNGWMFQAADTGAFFQDYLGRARVALGGLAALPPAEAMYLTALSPENRRLFDGDRPYRLHFPKDRLPPVDAFWSLTMYEATPEGQFFMTANPIKRYAIGDRTAGLKRDADGGLTIWIGRGDPGGERRANWLPAPAKGPYAMILRLYLPRPEAISAAWTPPRIEAA